MNTNNIQKLRDGGFTIEKTKDVNTVIAHDKPFKLVREGKDDYSVPLDESGKYSVTIGGYPSNGEIDYSVVQYATPFIFELNESAKQMVVESDESVDNISSVSLKAVKFAELNEKAEFYKTEDGKGTAFMKVDESTYVKAGNTIGASIELVADAKDDVYVAEMLDDEITSLSVEQKKNIVDHAPEGLSPDDFAEYVGHDLENIPGLESLDDEAYEALVHSLTQMYFNQ
ncbi:MAG: hypothetical protein JXR12_15335 [Neptunomonas phycophila]|uniref:hypothetical protein n=1 Tax=Neptunomonas phycophila TaxID=1572645 RepID=UPI003B8E6837